MLLLILLLELILLLLLQLLLLLLMLLRAAAAAAATAVLLLLLRFCYFSQNTVLEYVDFLNSKIYSFLLFDLHAHLQSTDTIEIKVEKLRTVVRQQNAITSLFPWGSRGGGIKWKLGDFHLLQFSSNFKIVMFLSYLSLLTQN